MTTSIESLRQILPSSEVNLIVYHANCSDGLGAALCGYLMHGEKINYYAAKHLLPGQDDETLLKSLEFLRGKGVDPKVLIVDFSYHRDFLLKLKGLISKLVLLDHHVTAMKTLSDLDFCYFDMNRSGATLAWDYFWKYRDVHNLGDTNEYGSEYPQLIRFIEDRDLWKWQLPNSHEFNTGLDCGYSPSTTPLSKLAEFIKSDGIVWMDNETLIAEMIRKGAVIQEYVDQQVANASRHALTLDTTSGKKVAIVNETHNVSTLGAHLSKTHDYTFLFHPDLEDGTIKVSMRSIGDKDCTVFAKMFGGGGHKNAAGFTWKHDLLALIDCIRLLRW